MNNSVFFLRKIDKTLTHELIIQRVKSINPTDCKSVYLQNDWFCQEDLEYLSLSDFQNLSLYEIKLTLFDIIIEKNNIFLIKY
jgi:hypothetical protein